MAVGPNIICVEVPEDAAREDGGAPEELPADRSLPGVPPRRGVCEAPRPPFPSSTQPRTQTGMNPQLHFYPEVFYKTG